MVDKYSERISAETLRFFLQVINGQDALKQRLKRIHPADIADALEDLSPTEQDRILELLETELKVEVLYEADEEDVEHFVEDAPVDKLVEIVSAMAADEAADLLAHAAPAKAAAVMIRLEPEQQADVRALRGYEPETAGGIMTTEFFAVTPTDTAAEIIARLKTEYEDLETANEMYVLGDGESLCGLIAVEDVITADADTTAQTLMDSATVTVQPSTDQEVCAQLMQKYDLSVLPVLAVGRRMLGIITVDDIMDIMAEEASEDMYLLAGVGAERPLRESIFVRAYKRLPWLAITMVGAGLVAPFLLGRFFHDILTRVVGLFLFLPAIMGISGNSGIQASTVTVRGLATGEIDIKDTWVHLRREVGVAFVIGLVCAAAIWGSTYLNMRNAPMAQKSAQFVIIFSSTVAVSLFAGVMGAVLIGTLIPLLCVRMGIDPAIAAGPFVTTLIDISAQIIYLGLATYLLL